MDPAVAGALIGIVGTASVSIATQWIGLKREAAQLRHATRLQTDADARSVLDDALASAVEARGHLQEVKRAVAQLERAADQGQVAQLALRRNTDDDLEHLFAAVERSDDRLRLMASRITIRFGGSRDPDSLTNAFYKVAALSLQAGSVAYHVQNKAMRGATGEAAGERAAAREGLASTDRMTELSRAVETAIDEFAAKAHEWSLRE